ncbi:MAG TPA: DUF5672 family protein [Gaiellaceae bacterium]|nr:DUF5672 family protein [Gaiellaceae bacterium]
MAANGGTVRGRVAIVVPAYRDALTADEETSLRHLDRYLSGYDRYLVRPRSGRLELPGFEPVRFPDRYFTSRHAYAALLLTPRFYATFRGYDYMLIHQLDALVLSNGLDEWCTGDVDYVGAPGVAVRWPRASELRNGGLSLRRIDAFLAVLRSRAYWMDPDEYWRVHWSGRPWPTRTLNRPRKYLKRLHAFNGVRWETRRWARRKGTNTSRTLGLSEDFFWSVEAARYEPGFRVAPVAQALRFAFEANPRVCLDLNGGALPFGCHGWSRYDREFWEPYLLKDGPERPSAPAPTSLRER